MPEGILPLQRPTARRVGEQLAKHMDLPLANRQNAPAYGPFMRRASSHLLLGIGLIGASLAGAQPARLESAAHTWKPMADWYRPELRITKLAPRSVEQSELRLRMGDDPRWAAPDWDDRAWQVIERTEVPLNAGVFWLRLRTRTTGREERVPALVLLAGNTYSWECYWDGVLIGARGKPGDSPSAEIEGRRSEDIELSENLAGPGENVVALRVSTYRSATLGARFTQLLFWTVPSEKLRDLRSKLDLLPALGVGAMLTIGLAAFLMWLLADRRLILALFSALCLSGALLVAVASEPMTWWAYPAWWGDFRRPGRIAMVVVVASLLLTAAMVQLFPPRRRFWLAVPLAIETTLACAFLPLGVNGLVPNLWRAAFLPALALAGWAVWQQRQGAWLVLAGLAATYGLFERNPRHFESTDFVFGFLPVTMGFIAAIAMRLRTERIQARDAKLTAARLEIELLKKSLQPHFLMNTLTALAQVIEEKPAAAVRLIDDLAAEFRSLARLSGEKLVSIGEELALCRAHLGVMSARTELPWKLEAAGVDSSATVPPALFLTLIENGLSHQRAEPDATTFTLRAEPTRDGIRYIFVSPGSVRLDVSRPGGGTGLRYVRARLEESFPEAWTMSQGAVAGGWETVIDLRLPKLGREGL